ncbi:MAG: hypothetical protein QG554_448, partial [Pseudomonadota bacterium]|nr:hypothetical protein [Pseudomonadota bacterium]
MRFGIACFSLGAHEVITHSYASARMGGAQS